MSLSSRASRTHGSPISELMARALANPRLISLAAGFVDTKTLPTEAAGLALEGMLAAHVEAAQALQYGTTVGYTPLREILLQRFLAEEQLASGDISIDRVVLTAGSNQLLHLVTETLCDPGDIVLCASPTYFVYLGLLENLGVRAIGIRSDAQGMCPDSLHRCLEHLQQTGQLERVKALYLVSYCDNPRGITLPAERRQQLMQVCHADRWEQRIVVIDDQAYRTLHLQSPPGPSLLAYDPSGENTVVAGTFSKSFSPGIRVGWGILPQRLAAPVCQLKGNIDFGSPNFNQHLMQRVLQLGLFDQHVEQLQARYRKKLATTLQALDDSLGHLPGVRWVVPDGGLYVWVELPGSVPTGAESPLFQRAIERGVLYVPGAYCYAAEGVEACMHTMRLSFGVPSEGAIVEGISALGQAVRDVWQDAT